MLPPWKKRYDQPRQNIKTQRHYFANKGQSSQSYSFTVVMYGYESWTIKKAECWRIDAFELWCWRRLLRVLRLQGDQTSPSWREYSSEGLRLRLKHTLTTWCEEPTHWKRPWCWEILKAGEGDDGGWDGWIASLTWWTWVWASSGRWWRAGVPGVTRSRTRLSEQQKWQMRASQ